MERCCSLAAILGMEMALLLNRTLRFLHGGFHANGLHDPASLKTCERRSNRSAPSASMCARECRRTEASTKRSSRHFPAQCARQNPDNQIGKSRFVAVSDSANN